MGARGLRVAALSALATLAALGLAELLLRALWPAPPAQPVAFRKFHPGEERRGLLVDDPRTAYALAPGYREAPEHAGAYATGAWPYRNEPPRAGLPAVWFLGDSCVYGVGVRPSETLPARAADALARRGLGAQALSVLNLGVPGYSTAQTLAELREHLRGGAPARAVFYLAAWNDQAPALVEPDAAILAARRGPRAWLRGSALGRMVARALGPAPAPADPGAVRAAWEERGERLRGARVPPAELAANVAAMLAACRAAGAEALVLLPAWPAASAARWPRLAEDRALVRAAAEAAGASVLDARAALDAAGLADAAAFVDHVHPSARAHEALGEAVARALAPGLVAGAARGGLMLEALEPASACALGDARVRVTLSGLGPDERPQVVVGHAPLLDLRALGDGRFEGTLMANGAGLHDVLVQAGERSALRAGGLELWDPRLELDRAQGALVLRARPGDTALLVASERLADVPALDGRGAAALDPGSVVGSFPLEVGADALARAPVDLRTVDPAGGLWAQALVSPRGTQGSGAQRYTPALDLRAALGAGAAEDD